MTKQLTELRERLKYDWPFYAANCLKIVNKSGDLVPFIPKPPQLELDRKLEEQRKAGRPMRAVILKARQIGFSTYAQGKIVQRVTQRPNHHALVVAQDNKSAGELFSKGETMHAYLPTEPALNLKPPIANRRHQRALYFGEGSRQARERGEFGINSYLLVDTAKEVEAGRGFTYHSLHLSEVAFWEQVAKMTALLNAVPDDPETLVLQESTARGFNHFKKTWDRAYDGTSGYVAHFESWLGEPEYQLGFFDEDERQAFISSIGTGPYAEDEEELYGELEATPEQLNWRRFTIDTKLEGDVRLFHQEYPSTPREAFLSTGDTVFSAILIDRVIRETEQTDPPQTSPDNPGPEYGRLVAQKAATIKTPYGLMELPQEPLWTPESSRRPDGLWRVWEHPVERSEDRTIDGEKVVTPAGQYVVAIDPAGGEPLEVGQVARHAIQVIDHRTREQVAEYVSQIDPDLVAVEAYLAALHWNRAWLGIEITGGYGLSIARRIARAYKYPFVYRRKTPDTPQDAGDLKRVGWSTDVRTKPMIEDLGKALLRTGEHGIRSRLMALEMQTYIRYENGRTGPEKGEYSDRLLAWLIAQQIAQEKPLKPDRKPGTGAVPISTHRTRSARTGY